MENQNSSKNNEEFANPASRELEEVPSSGGEKMRPKVPRTGEDGFIDYLDEDPEIPSQKYFLFSYARTKDAINGEHQYGFKVRGSAPTEEDLRKRIDVLRSVDKDTNIYTCPVGMWLPFCPNPADIGDQEYQADLLNDIIKGKKKNQLQAKRQFEERKQRMMEKAIEEGSAEGQARLASMKDHPKAVEMRINTLKNDLKELHEREEELKDILLKEKKKMNAFTHEELEKAEIELKEWTRELEDAEDPRKKAMELVDKYGAEMVNVVNQKTNALRKSEGETPLPPEV